MSSYPTARALEGAALPAENVRPTLQLPRFSLLRKLVEALQRSHSLLGGVLGVTRQRRLQVTETASLGEKRFVSIVTVDGVEYLIGGGGASVSLLARLPGENIQPAVSFPAAVEQAWRNQEQA